MDRAEIAAALDDADPKKRRDALEKIALGVEIDGQRVDPALADKARKLASDEAPIVRAEAAVLLAILPGDDLQASLQRLSRLLEDESPLVRREAAAALGDLKDRTAAAQLGKHLEDDDEQTRFEAAFALASLGDDRGLPILIRTLTDNQRRYDALEALRRLKSPAALEPLARLCDKILLGWPERMTAYATRYAIGDRSAADYLIKRLKAWSRAERSLALGLIGTHKIVEARDPVRAIAGDPRDALHETAAETLLALDAG